MPDFRFAESEFDRQAVILDTLMTIVETAGYNDPAAPVNIAGHALPIVPAGAQNTMTAAAIVLLAAHFEEYVRQQIEEYMTGVLAEYAHLSVEAREKLIDAYWRAGSSKIARIKPKGSPGWNATAEPLLRSLIQYPVQGDLASFDPKLICEHENNMRWETVSELCGRVGVKKLSNLMHRWRPLFNELGQPKVDDMTTALRAKLNEYFELRNSIVHSISQNAGIGVTIVRGWLTFFRAFAPALGAALDISFADFETDMRKAREKAARAAAAAANPAPAAAAAPGP